MAGKKIAVKKYVVRLSAEERDQLNDMIRSGKRSAQLLTKARLRLKADASDAGEGWSDSRIVQALDPSIAKIERTRRQLVEEGVAAVLIRARHRGDVSSIIPNFRRDRSLPASRLSCASPVVSASRTGRPLVSTTV